MLSRKLPPRCCSWPPPCACNSSPLRPDRNLLAERERRSFVRAATSVALAAAKGADPAKILRSAWPDDDRAALILRGVSDPTSTADYPGLDVVTTLPQLAPQSAALALFARGGQLDLAGKRTIAVPNIALPPTPVFVAEAEPGPSVEFSFGRAVLGPVRKILVFSAVTRELEQASPEAASVIVARILADAAGKGVDLAAFSSFAGDTTTPPGLLVGTTPITAATAGSEAMTQDIANLTKAIADAFIDPTGVVFIAAPRQAMALRIKPSPLFDNPVIMAAALPDKTVIAAAPIGIFWGGDGRPEIESSKEGLLHFERSTPLALVDGAGVVAAPQRSLFQTDAISIKCRASVAWCAYPGSIQIVEGANWP
jgi:hypothetical protein